GNGGVGLPSIQEDRTVLLNLMLRSSPGIVILDQALAFTSPRYLRPIFLSLTFLLLAILLPPRLSIPPRPPQTGLTALLSRVFALKADSGWTIKEEGFVRVWTLGMFLRFDVEVEGDVGRVGRCLENVEGMRRWHSSWVDVRGFAREDDGDGLMGFVKGEVGSQWGFGMTSVRHSEMGEIVGAKRLEVGLIGMVVC
ncbi:hypothetical protein BC829DRAFT_407942, partial [Chytridium lagenaria]